MLAGEPSAVIAFPLQNPPEALHRAVINAMGNTGHTFNAELYVWFRLLGKKAPGPSDSYCIAHCCIVLPSTPTSAAAPLMLTSPARYFLRQCRIILRADTASEG